MSLVQILGLVFTALLLVIWGMRSVHKGYERAEDDDGFSRLPPMDNSTIQDFSEYSKIEDLEKHDTRPIPLQDLDTAPSGR